MRVRAVLLAIVLGLLAWPIGPAQGTSAASDAPIERRVAVMLVNFASQPSEPWTKDFVRDIYFGPTNSVASYYAELSNGRMSITGSVFGYLTVSANLSECYYKSWASAARSKAKSSGINLATYTDFVYVFPYQPRCWWSGYALGGSAALPGRNNWINGLMSLYIASHELGHSLGAGHAGSLSCTAGGERVAFSATCSTFAYGDPFDVMGYAGQRHMHAWHRWQIGLLGSSEVATAAANGVYRLSPAQVAGDHPRMLLVPRPAGGNYVIEFRRIHGAYDDFPVGAPAVTGVSIRLVTSTKKPTKLIDTRPETCTFTDAPLAVGRTFVDKANRIAITTVSVGSTHAEIRVTTDFDGPAQSNDVEPDSTSDSSPPMAPTSLGSNLITARSVAVTWSAAEDDVGVDRYLVRVDGVSVGSTCDLMRRNIAVSDARTYEFSVQAVDFAGNIGPAASVRMWIPDVTPPTRPASLSASVTSKSTITLKWRLATDNAGVSRYRLRRNGVIVAELSPGATSYSDGSLVRGRTYRYALTAIDAAGNSSASAKVRKSLP